MFCPQGQHLYQDIQILRPRSTYSLVTTFYNLPFLLHPLFPLTPLFTHLPPPFIFLILSLLFLLSSFLFPLSSSSSSSSSPSQCQTDSAQKQIIDFVGGVERERLQINKIPTKLMSGEFLLCIQIGDARFDRPLPSLSLGLGALRRCLFVSTCSADIFLLSTPLFHHPPFIGEMQSLCQEE